MNIESLSFNPQGVASTFIEGPAGQIETVINRPAEPDSHKPFVVLCHPHPLYGGTLTNKVVHVLAQAFAEMGHWVVRFNFRGVGQSAGSFDNTVGETDDLRAVVAEMKQALPGAPLWLGGFSFGSYIAASAHVELGAEKLLLVAPPASMYGFEDISPQIPWVVMQGSADEVIDAQAVKKWLESCPNPPHLLWLEGGSHFFHGQLNWLKSSLRANWPKL